MTWDLTEDLFAKKVTSAKVMLQYRSLDEVDCGLLSDSQKANPAFFFHCRCDSAVCV